eukprot:GHVT01006031.1.p1 GENE.GHVT01006031.1~~GHVT01006031.1.p1  ORF type:complete len:344 (-),score=27.51 GHVT01006031.1:96-1127(-)
MINLSPQCHYKRTGGVFPLARATKMRVFDVILVFLIVFLHPKGIREMTTSSSAHVDEKTVRHVFAELHGKNCTPPARRQRRLYSSEDSVAAPKRLRSKSQRLVTSTRDSSVGPASLLEAFFDESAAKREQRRCKAALLMQRNNRIKHSLLPACPSSKVNGGSPSAVADARDQLVTASHHPTSRPTSIKPQNISSEAPRSKRMIALRVVLPLAVTLAMLGIIGGGIAAVSFDEKEPLEVPLELDISTQKAEIDALFKGGRSVVNLTRQTVSTNLPPSNAPYDPIGPDVTQSVGNLKAEMSEPGNKVKLVDCWKQRSIDAVFFKLKDLPRTVISSCMYATLFNQP